MVKLMIPLTGRNCQQSSFTLAISPIPPAQPLSSNLAGWPNLPDLASDTADFHSNLSSHELHLHGMLHSDASANQQAHTDGIYSSEQLDESLFGHDLSDLSAFAHLDFDDMLAHAANELDSTHHHLQQQHSLCNPHLQHTNEQTPATVRRTASPSSASAVSQHVSPVVVSPQAFQPIKPPKAALRTMHAARSAFPHATAVDERAADEQTSSDIVPAESEDYEPDHSSKARGPRITLRKPCIKKSKAKKAKGARKPSQYNTRFNPVSVRQAPASRQADEPCRDLAEQHSLSSQEQQQHSSSLTHLSHQTPITGEHASTGAMTALAEGTKLLLKSVRAANNPKKKLPVLHEVHISQAPPASGSIATPSTDQRWPDLKHRLRSTLAASPPWVPELAPAQKARTAATSPAKSAAAAARTATAKHVTPAETAAVPMLSAVKTPIKAAQRASPQVASLPRSAVKQAAVTVTTASQTDISSQGLKASDPASDAVGVAKVQQKPNSTATKATQTQLDKPAAVTLGTQTVAPPSSTSPIKSISPVKSGTDFSVRKQPKAMVDAAQTLSQLAVSASHSPRQFSPAASPKLVSPERSAGAQAADCAPHKMQDRNRQLHLSPDARDRMPDIRSPTAQRIISSQHGASGSPSGLGLTRTFRGRSVQPALHEHSVKLSLHEHSMKPSAAATAQHDIANSYGSGHRTGMTSPLTPKAANDVTAVLTPATADVNPLLADIMGTAGCRVTRRLVHSVMAADTRLTSPNAKERLSATGPPAGTARSSGIAPASQLKKKYTAHQNIKSEDSFGQELGQSPAQSKGSKQDTAGKTQHSKSASPHRVRKPGKPDLSNRMREGMTGMPARLSPAFAGAQPRTSNIAAADTLKTAKAIADPASKTLLDQTDKDAAQSTSQGLASAAGNSTAVGTGQQDAVAHAASQRSMKRQLSDAPERSEMPKRSKAQCLTAAGLNPKFLATKDEVMQLIGDRQHVLEGELRRRMGNNPDTSKALRKLHKEGALARAGAGGRSDPFKWTKAVDSTAASEVARDA